MATDKRTGAQTRGRRKTAGRTAAVTTSTATSRKKQAIKPRPLLEWEATEYQPRFGIWRLIGTGLLGAWLTLFLVLLGQWSFALVAAVITIAILIVRGGKPRTWRYTFTKKELRIEPRSRHGIGTRRPLTDFRAFTVEEDSPHHGEKKRTVVLLPVKRLGIVTELYLAGDIDADVKLLDKLAELVPYDEAAYYLTTERIVHRIARTLRLE